MPEKNQNSDGAARTHGDLVGPLKAVGKFIGWLSGSLAAITGVLYGLGYLVTLSNLYSLGLNFYLFDFDPSLYLTRGANFVLYFTQSIFKMMFFLIFLISPFVVIAYFLYRFWLKDRFLGKGGTTIDWIRKRSMIWQGLIFAALVGILFLDLWPRYERLSEILRISHMLFGSQVSDLNPEIEIVRNAILNQGPRSANTTGTVFFTYQLFLIEAAVLLYLAWRVTAAWRFGALLAAPFALVLAMSVVTLPMIYGILIISNEFPTIRVITGDPSGAPRSSELYLLSKTDNEFILWDSNNRKVLWLPLSSVRSAEIGRSKSLPAHAKSDDGKVP